MPSLGGNAHCALDRHRLASTQLCTGRHMTCRYERVAIPPELQPALDRIIADRSHGAAQLACWVLDALKGAGALAAEGLGIPLCGAFVARFRARLVFVQLWQACLQGILNKAETTCDCVSAVVWSHGPKQRNGRLASKQAVAAALGRMLHIIWRHADRAHLPACPSACLPACLLSEFAQILNRRGNPEDEGIEALDAIRNYGYHLATARPSMAPLANAAAAVLSRVHRDLTSRAEAFPVTQGHACSEVVKVGCRSCTFFLLPFPISLCLVHFK